MARALFSSALRSGPQPLDLTVHLRGVADLIELCFEREMDASGRSFIAEMRTLAHWGWLLRALTDLGLSQYIWSQGFVWVDDGRVVGSVSAQPDPNRSGVWLIANVATHPNHRRRGIARSLMHATLNHIQQRGGHTVLLQVDDDNLPAFDLYRDLGFVHVATHTLWYHNSPGGFHAPAPANVHIRRRAPAEWRAHWALAQTTRPEGLHWNRPLAEKDFNPGWLETVWQALSGQRVTHWVMTPPNQPGLLMAVLTTREDAFGFSEWELLTQPAYRGQAERPLLEHALALAQGAPLSARLEHPSADAEANLVLRDLRFNPARVLRWMEKHF